MAMLDRCLTYRESNRRSKGREGPILGVNFTEVSVLTILFTIVLIDSNKLTKNNRIFKKIISLEISYVERPL